jgi:hypothetical protein
MTARWTAHGRLAIRVTLRIPVIRSQVLPEKAGVHGPSSTPSDQRRSACRSDCPAAALAIRRPADHSRAGKRQVGDRVAPFDGQATTRRNDTFTDRPGDENVTALRSPWITLGYARGRGRQPTAPNAPRRSIESDPSASSAVNGILRPAPSR